MPLCVSLLDKGSLITRVLCHFAASCQKTNCTVRQRNGQKWAPHVGNCTPGTVVQHLFMEIISAQAAHHHQQVPHSLFRYESRTVEGVRKRALSGLAACFLFLLDGSPPRNRNTNVTELDDSETDRFSPLNRFLVIQGGL